MMCGMDEELLVAALQEILKRIRRHDLNGELILQRNLENLGEASHGLSLQDIADVVSKDPDINTIEPSPYRYSFMYIVQIIIRNHMLPEGRQ